MMTHHALQHNHAGRATQRQADNDIRFNATKTTFKRGRIERGFKERAALYTVHTNNTPRGVIGGLR